MNVLVSSSPPKVHPKTNFGPSEEGIKIQTVEKGDKGLYFKPSIELIA